MIVAKQEDHCVARTNKTQSEIKILAKRRNIELLGQIFRDNESGRPNRTHKIIRTNKINRNHKIIRTNKIAQTLIEQL